MRHFRHICEEVLGPVFDKYGLDVRIDEVKPYGQEYGAYNPECGLRFYWENRVDLYFAAMLVFRLGSVPGYVGDEPDNVHIVPAARAAGLGDHKDFYNVESVRLAGILQTYRDWLEGPLSSFFSGERSFVIEELKRIHAAAATSGRALPWLPPRV